MLEILIVKYPNRFDLPGENDIRADVSKLTRTSKKLDELLQPHSMRKENDENLVSYPHSDNG